MNALNELSELDLKVKRDKYKNVPEYALPKMKMKSNANGVTQSIIKYLSLNGHFASRTSSSGRYLVAEKKWIPGTTKKGFPDITATVNGKALFIEVKIKKDRMSNDQLKVKAEIERSGGIYHIAKDLDSFLTFYKTLQA